LVGGLAGDAETGGDVCPGEAGIAKSEDGVFEDVVEFMAELGQRGQAFDVAAGDTSAVGGDDAADKAGVVVVLHDVPAGPGRTGRASAGWAVWCQGRVDGWDAHRTPRGSTDACGLSAALRACEAGNRFDEFRVLIVPESVVIEPAILSRIPGTARTTSTVTIRVNMGRLLR
jgi:hypothetical protein